MHASSALADTGTARPPDDFLCPVTRELMRDPVLLVETGHTYERAAISYWFNQGKHSCPKTGRKLRSLLLSPNFTLRAAIISWAEQNGFNQYQPSGTEAEASAATLHPITAAPAVSTAEEAQRLYSSSQASVHSHPLTLDLDQFQNLSLADQGGDTAMDVEPEPEAGSLGVLATMEQLGVPNDPDNGWTFFEGVDSPGGDLLRIYANGSNLREIAEAANKVGGCIAFNTDGYLKHCLRPRPNWVQWEDAAPSSSPASSSSIPSSGSSVPTTTSRGLYVRTQCLPFLNVGCNSSATEAGIPASGWTFFPGLDSPGGDICQAMPAGGLEDTSSGMATAETGSSSISASSSHSLALMALAKPFCVAFNTNGWLKALLQPMHGWVKWTAETGKGLFVRNDVVLALMQGVLAHVQGNHSAPVQLAGWTFFQGLDSLGGDVVWSWQHANDPTKLASDSVLIQGVVAFNTNGYLKSQLRPRREWTKVEAWADKPCSGVYVHNSVLWKLLVA